MAEPATNKRACTAAVIRRDWANLPAGPAGLIAERLLTDGVTAYLRFRQVCAAWRRCTEPPSSPHDSRFHPRRWIMLPEVFAACPDRRDFLNVSTGECIRVDLPELRHRLVLGPTSEGLLLLLCGNGTGDLHLLNPLTKQLTPLPNATGTCLLSKLNKLQVCNAGLADNSTILLPFHDRRQVEMAVARLGDDEQWSYHSWPESDSDSIVSTTLLSFSNRFYCVTSKGIKALDISAAAGQRPKLVVAAVEKDDDQGFYSAGDILVDNDGELIMVGPTPGKKMPNYQAHRVDLVAGKMVPINDLRGHAVFVCNHTGRSVSVRAAIFPSIRADTVYRCRRSSGGDDEDEDGRPSVVACHVKKGWVRCKVRFDRGSIEDYLSRYVCRSKDIVVPAPPLRRSLCWPAAAVPRKRKANPKVFGDDWFN